MPKVTFEFATLADLVEKLQTFTDECQQSATPLNHGNGVQPVGPVAPVQPIVAAPDPSTAVVVPLPGTVGAVQPGEQQPLPGQPADPSIAGVGATGAASPVAGAVLPLPIGAPTAGATPQLGGDLDSAGFPHNPDFDAKNRAQLADGTWRLKRGCDKPGREAWQKLYRATYPLDGPAAGAPVTANPLGAALDSGAVTGQPTAPDAGNPVNRCLSLATALYQGRDQAGFDTIGAALQEACTAQGLQSTNDLVQRPECAVTFFAALQQVAQQHGIVDSNECRPL